MLCHFNQLCAILAFFARYFRYFWRLIYENKPRSPNLPLTTLCGYNIIRYFYLLAAMLIGNNYYK